MSDILIIEDDEKLHDVLDLALIEVLEGTGTVDDLLIALRSLSINDYK